MPFVRGFLKVGRRHRPGRPVDPDYGIDEGERPEVSPPDPDGDGDLEIGGGPIIPEPPIGIWPPLTPEHPWRPIPGWPDRPSTGPVRPQPGPGQPPQPGQPLPPTGEGGEAGQLPTLPPGAIWPPLPPGVHGKYLALVLVAGMPGVKYRYVVIDADARPPHRPDQSLPGEAQPK